MTLTLLVSLCFSGAQAAEVTELAPMLRGDLKVAYTTDAQRGRLVESEQTVARRNLTDHLMTWSLDVGVYTGVALVVEMPHYVSQRVRFPEASQMDYDPISGEGSLLGSDPVGSTEAEVGAGLGGTWIGIKGSPYHQEIWGDRGDRASVLFEAAYRFEDTTNFYSYGPRGTRGGGPGASAFRLRGAFSTTHRNTQPYLVGTWTRSGRITQDVVDAGGRVVSSGSTFTPASELDLRAGAEFKLDSYQDGGEVDFDLSGRFGYRSWQDIPSGLYLADVLDASVGRTATEEEYAFVAARAGINWRMVHYLQLNVAGEVGLTTPRTIEHFYPVSTGMGTWTWGVLTSLRFRLRDELVDSWKPATLSD